MGILRRRRPYDRARNLAEAARARAKRNPRKAVALLREVLEHEPGNLDAHRRVASLLVAMGKEDDAWQSYRSAAAGLLRKGFVERATGVLREAASLLPRRREVWETLAAAEQERGRSADAHRALLEGRRHFRAWRQRGDAIRLLAAARRLDATHFEANVDLAHLLARCGQREAAARILDGLARHARGRSLRRVRWRQLRLVPGFGALWRWARAWRKSVTVAPAAVGSPSRSRP